MKVPNFQHAHNSFSIVFEYFLAHTVPHARPLGTEYVFSIFSVQIYIEKWKDTATCP